MPDRRGMTEAEFSLVQKAATWSSDVYDRGFQAGPGNSSRAFAEWPVEVSDRSRFVISFKGTSNFQNAWDDLDLREEPFAVPPGWPSPSTTPIIVHRGFMRALSHLYEEVARRLERVGTGVQIVVTGHSLGGAMATLMSLALLAKGYSNIVLITFGAPAMGTSSFKAQMQKFMSAGQLEVFRIANRSDPINYLVQFGCTVLGAWVPKYEHIKDAIFLDPWLAGMAKGFTHIVGAIWNGIGRGVRSLWDLTKGLGEWLCKFLPTYGEHCMGKYISNLKLCLRDSFDRLATHTLDVVKHTIWAVRKSIVNTVTGLLPDCVKDALTDVWNFGADCLHSLAGYCGKLITRGLGFLGGVQIGGRARLLGGSIRGSCLVLNLAQGRIHPKILAAAFQHVFSPNGFQDPSFSLDPADDLNPNGKYQQRRCWPDSVKDTVIEQIMWEADWKMKQYSLELIWDDDLEQKRQVDYSKLQNNGIRNYPRHDLSSCNGQKGHVRHRLWFVCNGVDVNVSQEGGSLDLRAHIGVRVQRIDVGSDGRLQDVELLSDPMAVQYAQSLTQEFDGWSQVEPAYAELANLQIAVALAKYYRDELHVPAAMLNKSWINEHNQECASMKYSRFTVPRLHNEFRHETPSQEGTEICTVRVSGGVNMSCNLKMNHRRVLDQVSEPVAQKCHDLGSLKCYDLDAPTEAPSTDDESLDDQSQSRFSPPPRRPDEVFPIPIFLPECAEPGCTRVVSLPEQPETWRSTTASTCNGRPWCWEHHPLRCTDRDCPAPALPVLESNCGWSAQAYRGSHPCHLACARDWFRKGNLLQIRGVGKAGYNQRILPVASVDRLRSRVMLDQSMGASPASSGSFWSLRPQNLVGPEDFWIRGQLAVPHTVKSDVSLQLRAGTIQAITATGRIQLRFPGHTSEKTLRPENLWTTRSEVLIARLQSREDLNGKKAIIAGFSMRQAGPTPAIRAEVQISSQKLSVPLTALDPIF